MTKTMMTVAAILALPSIVAAQVPAGSTRISPDINPALNENATVPNRQNGVAVDGTNDAKVGGSRSDGGTATGGPVGGPMTGGGGR